jgi:hypothetical protein
VGGELFDTLELVAFGMYLFQANQSLGNLYSAEPRGWTAYGAKLGEISLTFHKDWGAWAPLTKRAPPMAIYSRSTTRLCTARVIFVGDPNDQRNETIMNLCIRRGETASDSIGSREVNDDGVGRHPVHVAGHQGLAYNIMNGVVQPQRGQRRSVRILR